MCDFRYGIHFHKSLVKNLWAHTHAHTFSTFAQRKYVHSAVNMKPISNIATHSIACTWFHFAASHNVQGVDVNGAILPAPMHWHARHIIIQPNPEQKILHFANCCILLLLCVCVCVDGMFFFRVLCSTIEWNKSTGWTEWVSKQCGKMCVIVTHKYHVTHLSLLLVLLLLADWRSWSCSFFEVHTFYISVIHISESTQLSPSSFTLILRVVAGMRWTEMD